MRSYGKLMEGVNTPVKKESGDLISRSALIEVLTKYKFGAISNEIEREYTKEAVLQFVQTAPCAYNVDKVVAELETLTEKYMANSEKASELGVDYERHMVLYGAKGMAFEEAIEIVKKGGVE